MSKEKKIIAAKKAFEYIEEGMKLGLGTGSTADEFTKVLSEKVKDGFEIICIPTSENTKKLAETLKIPLGNLEDYNILDITIDGADEIDDNLSLLKGGGGALLREKIIAFNSKKMIVIADDSKKVSKLGDFKLPIEVIAFEHDTTIKRVLEKLEAIGYSGTADLRILNNLPFQTDSKNLIYDLSIGLIKEPSIIDNLLNTIPGVVENGLFVDMANIVILGEENGVKIIEK
ncbi:MAG: ribose-5-phosphate isomerase RpiA [Alphaproteobacteria bacterium]